MCHFVEPLPSLSQSVSYYLNDPLNFSVWGNHIFVVVMSSINFGSKTSATDLTLDSFNSLNNFNKSSSTDVVVVFVEVYSFKFNFPVSQFLVLETAIYLSTFFLILNSFFEYIEYWIEFVLSFFLLGVLKKIVYSTAKVSPGVFRIQECLNKTECTINYFTVFITINMQVEIVTLYL